MPDKLFLVDGSNQAFRAFFAIQTDMRAPDGFPTRALFGFTRVLIKLLREHQPSHIAVVFDVGKSFRNDLYPDYKGQRPDMPEDLRAQWPELVPLCQDLGIPAIAIDGYEADDIIGTLATRYAGVGMPCEIVSADKDFCQLVNDHVKLLDIQNDREFNRELVIERWGVPPELVIDLLSLMGDSSDNVPGVQGVGQKTAAKFLNKYGSANAVLDAAAEIGGKTGQRIGESRDVVALARQLVTIHTDMPVDFDLDALRLRPRDDRALAERLARYGFRRLVSELGLEEAVAAVPAGSVPGEAAPGGVDRSRYRTIETADELAWLVETLRAAGRFAYDSETTSLDPLTARFVGMSFAWEHGYGVYVPIGHRDGPSCPRALDALLPLLADPTLKKTGQNLKYDLEVLRANGADMRGIDGDTMIADYLLHVDQKHSLDEMARRHLGHDMISFAETAGRFGNDFSAVPVAEATQYAAEDAHVAWLLDHALALGPLERVYREIEVPLIPVLADMELTGIAVDVPALEALSVELERRIGVLAEQLYAEAGETFNLNSTQQLATILFDKRGLNPGKKTKKGYSTDAATLQGLVGSGDLLPEMILSYRELAKLKSTYVDALPRCVAADGRIHTSYHQTGAATGRLSSNDPNLQNIPIRTDEGRRIRTCFVAEDGYRFLSADYSQIELRVLAHFCGEGTLVDAFRAGEDIHRRTAAEIFGVHPGLVSADQRRAAKAINFGLIYGMSAFRLARDLKISRGEAQSYMDSYFARYPQVRTYMDGAVQRAKETGYAETLYGRRRPVSGLDARNPNDRGAAERVAMNTPIQGTAADLIKLAMIAVHRRISADFPTARLLLQVHDELVLEVPEADLEAVRAAVVAEMQGVAALAVPLVVDTGDGRTWGDAP